MALPVRTLAFWQIGLLYLLFIASSFSIAGMELGALGLMLLGLAHWRRNRPVSMPPRWLIVPYVAFIAAGLLSALINPETLRTLVQMKGEYRLFMPFALLPALALVDRKRLLRVYLVFMGLMALYGLVQYFYGVDWFRPEGKKLITPYVRNGAAVFHGKGHFSHHLTYAGFMLINVPFFLALFFQDRDRMRWAWAAGALLAAIGVTVSLGRSGWVGAAVGTGLLAFMLPRRWSWSLIGLGIATFAVLVGLMLSGKLQATFSSDDNPDFVKRLLSTSLSHDKDRLYLWEAGWLGLLDNPIVGVGPGNEDWVYEPYRQVVSQRHGGYQFINRASAGVHNLYLQIGFTYGVLGLGAYLWLFGAFFTYCIRAVRQARPEQGLEKGLLWGAVGGLGGSMAAAVFENNFFDSEVQNLIMVVMALAIHAGMRIAHPPAATPQ